MEVKADVSYYPFDERYREKILNLVEKLNEYGIAELQIETNRLSTQIFGDYDKIMGLLNEAMRNELQNDQGVFVIKIARGGD